MSSNRIPKALALAGTAITLIGITFKLNHLMGAHEIFNFGVVVLVLGLGIWAFKLISNK